MHTQNPLRKRLLVLLTLPLATLPVLAQIIADPNALGQQQPTVGVTANGIPQIDIQTPNAAGLSHNQYQQLDIQAQGAILNNSRETVQTQLGGYISGNPHLFQSGPAATILNQVNSSDPSVLKGYIEVAGQKANVIVANPSGITCDGCGFINAHRSTLTTGALIGSASSHALAGTATAYNEVNNNTLYPWKNRLIAIDQLKNDLVVALSGRDHAVLRAYIGPRGAVGGYLPATSGPTQINSMLNSLTSSTLYNLNYPDHFNTLQQQGAPDMGYHAINENNTFIHFQNGTDNATPDAQASSQLLQNLLNRPVGNIINDTQGIANDVAEYLPDYLETKDILNEYTYRKLNAKAQPTFIVTHSTGNEDARRALETGKLYGYQYPNLSFITVGSPLSQKNMHSAIEQAGAQHLAHIGGWRDPVTYAKTAVGTVLTTAVVGVGAGIWKGEVAGATAGGAAGTPGGIVGVVGLGAAGANLCGVREAMFSATVIVTSVI